MKSGGRTDYTHDLKISPQGSLNYKEKGTPSPWRNLANGLHYKASELSITGEGTNRNSVPSGGGKEIR